MICTSSDHMSYFRLIVFIKRDGLEFDERMFSGRRAKKYKKISLKIKSVH